MKNYNHYIQLVILVFCLLPGCNLQPDEAPNTSRHLHPEAMLIPDELVQFQWNGEQLINQSISPETAQLFPFLATPVAFEANQESLVSQILGDQVYLIDLETQSEFTIDLTINPQFFLTKTGQKIKYHLPCSDGLILNLVMGIGNTMLITDRPTNSGISERVILNESGGTTILVLENIINDEIFASRPAGPTPITPPLGESLPVLPSPISVSELAPNSANCQEGKTLLFIVTKPRILLQQCGNLLFFTNASSQWNECLGVLNLNGDCDICIVYNSVLIPGTANFQDSYSVYVDTQCQSSFRDQCSTII